MYKSTSTIILADFLFNLRLVAMVGIEPWAFWILGYYAKPQTTGASQKLHLL
jgi:hypothetical protein